MITRNRQSANLTIMPSLAQCLRIRRSTHASLRRSTRVYFQQHTTSLRRFVSELGDERRPSGVINRLSEYSCRQALDIQVLYNDQSKENNQSPGNFVREIRSLVAHVGVSALQVSHGFLSVITASLSASDLALRPPQTGLSFFLRSGIFDLVPSESAAKSRSPTSRPAFSVEGGKSFGSHPMLNTAYHFPASRLTVTVLIAPSMGRCSFSLTCPTP